MNPPDQITASVEYIPDSQVANIGGIIVEINPASKISDDELMLYVNRWLKDGSSLQNYIDYFNLAAKIVEVIADKYKNESGHPYSSMMKKEICEDLSKRLVMKVYENRTDLASISERDKIIEIITKSSDTIDVIVYLSNTKYGAAAKTWLVEEFKQVGKYIEKKGCLSCFKKK